VAVGARREKNRKRKRSSAGYSEGNAGFQSILNVLIVGSSAGDVGVAFRVVTRGGGEAIDTLASAGEQLEVAVAVACGAVVVAVLVTAGADAGAVGTLSCLGAVVVMFLVVCVGVGER
jgi:hypothetical protein